jgi:hypothetical protein
MTTNTIRRTYSIGNVLQLRVKLRQDPSLLRYLGRRLVDEDFKDFLQKLLELLPDSILIQTLRLSILDLVGHTLTVETLDRTAWRIAGNIARLQSGHHVPVWNRQATDEYVPLQIIRVVQTTRFEREHADLWFQVLAGTPTGQVIKKTWSRRFCAVASGRLGFSKPWRALAFKDVRQLFGMRCYGLIEVSRCGTSPDFEQLWLSDDDERIRPDALYKHNARLLKMRLRESPAFKCPKNYPDSLLCHTCVIGQDECPVSVHPKTYVQQMCPACNEFTWFDPVAGSRVCLACTRRLNN